MHKHKHTGVCGKLQLPSFSETLPQQTDGEEDMTGSAQSCYTEPQLSLFYTIILSFSPSIFLSKQRPQAKHHLQNASICPTSPKTPQFRSP